MLVAIKDEIASNQHVAPWSLADILVAFQRHLYTHSAPLSSRNAVHDDGHEGIQRTLHRLRRDFQSPTFARWFRTTLWLA
jgi:hypothetical protein